MASPGKYKKRKWTEKIRKREEHTHIKVQKIEVEL